MSQTSTSKNNDCNVVNVDIYKLVPFLGPRGATGGPDISLSKRDIIQKEANQTTNPPRSGESYFTMCLRQKRSVCTTKNTFVSLLN